MRDQRSGSIEDESGMKATRTIKPKRVAQTTARNAKQFALLVSTVKELKNLIAAQKSIPRIGLEVDPEWCQENPAECAETITRLRDALMRTLAHCDAAKHRGNAYRDEREAIVDALWGHAVLPQSRQQPLKRRATTPSRPRR